MQRHNGLLKASIVSATNEHRLGANEAPPAIISVFLGKQITAVLDKLEHAKAEEAIIINAKKEMKLGVANIPEILLDNTDRNRTSPFAFTGNRFEFRAVGSSANCGAAMLALNAAVAEQLILFKQEVCFCGRAILGMDANHVLTQCVLDKECDWCPGSGIQSLY